MLQNTTDRVLICLPDGRWLALSADLFREALQVARNSSHRLPSVLPHNPHQVW